MCLKSLGCLQLKVKLVQVAGTPGPTGAPGAAGSQIYVSDVDPDNSLYSNGDFYLNKVTGIYYKKEAGVWQAKGNLITGPQGAPGDDGTPGVILLQSGIGSTITSSGEASLLPFGYSVPANSLLSNWGILRFVGNIIVTNSSGVSGLNTVKFLLKMLGADVTVRPITSTNAQIAGVTTGSAVDIRFQVDVIRKSATEAFVNVLFQTSGNSDSFYNCAVVTGIDWTAAIPFQPYCNIANSVGGFNVALNNYRIELIKSV